MILNILTQSFDWKGVVADDTVFVAYLDSVWVEVQYDPETELEKLEKRQRWEDALDFLSEQIDFSLCFMLTG